MVFFGDAGHKRMSRNFDAKFGPPPAWDAAPTSPALILSAHFVVCAVLLLAIAPPFVTVPHLSLGRVFAISAATTCATVVMKRCGVRPLDVLPSACEIVHSSFTPDL